jgi:hypothetical protein
LQTNWTTRLRPFAQRLNPLPAEIFQKFEAQYYGSCFQCEWASDVLFQPGRLQRWEPLRLRHGLLNFSRPDVLRFLGKRVSLGGPLPAWFPDEITTSLKVRAAGERRQQAAANLVAQGTVGLLPPQVFAYLT